MKFPEAFYLYEVHFSGKMSTRRSEYYWMECMKWAHRILTGSPSGISSRTIGFVCTLFPISQHVLQRNVDFVGIGNRTLWHPCLWSIALLIIVFMFWTVICVRLSQGCSINWRGQSTGVWQLKVWEFRKNTGRSLGIWSSMGSSGKCMPRGDC